MTAIAVLTQNSGFGRKLMAFKDDNLVKKITKSDFFDQVVIF